MTSTSTSPGERRPHVLGDLGIVVSEDGDALRSTMELSKYMAFPGTTSLRASVIATWADALLGLVAIRHIAPGLAVTLELEVDLFRAVEPIGTLEARGFVVKAGRAAIVTGARMVDAAGTPVGICNATFMASPDPRMTMPEGSWALDRFSSRRGVLKESFAKAAGCVRGEAGSASLPNAPHVANSGKTLNGGFLALVVEEAVLSANSDATPSSMSLRFLRPVRQGPAVARAEIHGDVGVVELRDAGTDVLAATATTRSIRASVG